MDTPVEIKFKIASKNINTGDKYAPRNANMGTIGAESPSLTGKQMDYYPFENTDVIVNKTKQK
jgi:hypothetical protein